jgi:hypothetical protein
VPLPVVRLFPKLFVFFGCITLGCLGAEKAFVFYLALVFYRFFDALDLEPKPFMFSFGIVNPIIFDIS